MQDNPNYSEYSLRELQQARASIDEVAFPDRTRLIDSFIKRKVDELGQEELTSRSSTFDSGLSVKKLPLLSIFIEALTFPIKHARLLPKIVLPMAILWTLVFAGSFGFSLASSTESFGFNIVLILILFLLTFLLFVQLAINCHRVALLGDNAFKDLKYLIWTGNEIRFMGWLLLLGIIVFLIMIPLSVVVSFVLSLYGQEEIVRAAQGNFSSLYFISLLFLPVYYLAPRWFLVLPSSAIGVHGKSLTWSWNLSSGNSGRLFILVGLLPFILEVVLGFFPMSDSVFVSILYAIFGMYVLIVEIVLLSISYRFLTDARQVD